MWKIPQKWRRAHATHTHTHSEAQNIRSNNESRALPLLRHHHSAPSNRHSNAINILNLGLDQLNGRRGCRCWEGIAELRTEKSNFGRATQPEHNWRTSSPPTSPPSNRHGNAISMYNQGFDPFNIIRGCRGWEGIAGLRTEDASWAISGGCEVDDPVAMRKSKQADWSSWQIRGIISFIHGIHSLQGHIHVLTMAKINARRYQHYPP